MGRIVHLGGDGLWKTLEPRRAARRTAAPPGPVRRALVLGSGGIGGAAFEVGALLALEAAWAEFGGDEFDLYIGTSAGAFVAACLALGVGPADLVRAATAGPGGGHAGGDDGIPALDGPDVLRPAPGRLRQSAAALGHGFAASVRRLVRPPRSQALIEAGSALAEALTSLSRATTDGLAEYVARLLDARGRGDGFEDVRAALLLPATDLTTGARVVFGEPGAPSCVLSQAVAASCAIPVVYEPVVIGGIPYCDGGMTSAVNLDVALSHGATFVAVINPLVPHRDPAAPPDGLLALVSQMMRIAARSQLDRELRLAAATHPEVDILVIEPAPEDHASLENLMDWSAWRPAATAAFERVALELVTGFPKVREILRRAGLPASRQRLVAQLEHVLAGGLPPGIAAMAGQPSSPPDPRLYRRPA